MRLFIFSIIIFATYSIFSQTNNELALEYYRKSEFEKAIPLLEELYEQNKLSTHLDMLMNSYKQIEDFNNAEKFLKKAIRTDKSNISLLVELGVLYEAKNDFNKAKKYFEDAIDQMPNNVHQIIQLGRTFSNHGKYDYEEKCYLKGQKIVDGDYTFSFELGEVYLRLREFDKMVFEYLQLISKDISYLPSVQARIQSILYYDTDKSISNILQQQLNQRLQKAPNNEIINDLYIWFLIQEREYTTALYQAKAIDRRTNGNGSKIFEIGTLALDNQQYSVSIDAFQYLISKSLKNQFYRKARKKIIEANQKMILSDKYNLTKIEELESLYLSTLEELGYTEETIDLIRELAKFQTYYLNKADIAIELLEKSLNTMRLNNNEKYQTLNTLAEIHLFGGDIWEANLLYARVEKDNANNPLGHEAKYMRAKISYYTGEFGWAQALLDILKASTSKLIANDAMELSLIISDNTALDTTTDAMKLYANADLLFFQKKDSLAIFTLDSISLLFPKHSLVDEIEYKKAQIAKQSSNYEIAAKHFENIVNLYSYDIYADKAIFYLADLLENKLNNPEKARELYRKLMLEYQNSIFVEESRMRYRILRGDNLTN